MNLNSKSKTRVHRLRDRLREATASEILDAAEEVFGRDGLHAARMEDVAVRAGVSVGTLYNYFSDRDALVVELWASRCEVLLTELDKALEATRDAPFDEQVERLLTTFFAHFEAHRRLVTILLQGETGLGSPKPGSRETMKAIHQRFETLVERGIALGALSASAASLYPALLLGMVRGVLMRRIHDETAASRQLMDDVPQLTRFFLRGAAP